MGIKGEFSLFYQASWLMVPGENQAMRLYNLPEMLL